MSRTSLRHHEDERPEDLSAVREALTAKGLDESDVRAQGAVLVPDVAEATGLPPDVVVRHLDRIRSETAWTLPAKSREHLLVAAGIVTLAIGLGAVWMRSHAVEATPTFGHFRPAQHGWAPLTVSPQTQRISSQSRSLSAFMDMRIRQQAPPGTTLHVFANGVYCMSQGQQIGPAVKAMPYQSEKNALTAAITALVQSGESQSRPVASVGELVRDYTGAVFTVQQGKAHITLDGWPGTSSFWLSEPLGAAEQARIDAEVTRYLAEAEQKQTEGLNSVVDPRTGLVSPPPGVQIEFAGRRLDTQNGPRLAFSDVEEAKFAKRIEMAIRNAFERDHRPPSGQWSGPADVDRKTPIPALSRVTITRGNDATSIDLPTSAKWTGKDDQLVANFAKAWASKIVRELSDNANNAHQP